MNEVSSSSLREPALYKGMVFAHSSAQPVNVLGASAVIPRCIVQIRVRISLLMISRSMQGYSYTVHRKDDHHSFH